MRIGLCGKSGTGKDTISKELQRLGYKKIITDTTRPMRPGEENGVDYFFDTDEEFDDFEATGEFIETTSYKVANGQIWRYGTTIGQFNDSGDNSVIILNPDGVKAFRAKKIPIKIVLINTNDELLLSRLETRGDKSDEIKRRLEADKKDFKGIEQYVDLQVKNDEKSNIKKLAKYIIKHLSEDKKDE